MSVPTPVRAAPPRPSSSRPAASGTTVEFAHAARVLAREARRRGLVVPSFRSPPRIVGVQRTLRRHPGGVTVAVQVRGRPWFAVVADMIEGVVVANPPSPEVARQVDRLRTELWEALGYDLDTGPGAAATREQRRATRGAPSDGGVDRVA